MKTLSLFILGVALVSTLSFKSFGQNTSPWPSNGNVGIGTTSPSYPLDVVGNINGTGVIGQTLWTGDGAQGMIRKLNSSIPLRFLTSSGAEEMRISANGNVGIGTMDPGYKLDVNGTGNFSGTLTGTSAMFGGYGEFGNTITPANNAVALLLGSESNSNEGNSVRLGFKTKISLGGGIYTNAAIDAVTTNVLSSVYGSLAFSTMNATTMTEKMRITNDGNVGIGTSAPGTLVHLVAPRAVETIQATGDHASLSLIAADNGGGGAPSVYLSRGVGNLYGALIVERGTGGGNVPIFTGGIANDVILGSKALVPVKFGVNGDVKMTINTSGNVGIGTDSPDSKLTVAGKIHSQEVKVSVAAGADFVFDEGYQLRTLAETEQYIKANKHLPEIASVNEMKKNGIELGEMNIKLLQKIEELTLHLIEQGKQLAQKDKDLQVLTERVSKLEK